MTYLHLNGGPRDGQLIQALSVPHATREIVFLSDDPHLVEFQSEQAEVDLPLTTVTYLQAHYDDTTDTFEYVWEGMIDRS